MVCIRCNKPSNDSQKCATCGTPLRTLASQRRRGWVACGAGVVLVVLMGGVWLWIDRLFAANGGTAGSPGAAQFLGKLNIAFALIVVSGALGVANGWAMAQTGRRNMPLIFGMIVVFAAGLFLAVSASSGYQPNGG
jgi:hypothetical protein